MPAGRSLPIHLVRAGETLTFKHGGAGRPLWEFQITIADLREALRVVGVGTGGSS